MKYGVNIQEVSYGSVEVEADSEDEARDIAHDKYSEGFVNWGKTDVTTHEVTKIGVSGG